MKTKTWSIQFKIDTSADLTVIRYQLLKQMGLKKSELKRQNKINPTEQKLKCIGFVAVSLPCESKKYQQTLDVCENTQIVLLRKPALSALNIVQISQTPDISCCEVKVAQVDGKTFMEFPIVF